jgi:Tfp pilus assembly protein PilN
VLALCIAAVASYVLAGNAVKEREVTLARATSDAAAVSRQATALKPYADFEAVANARVATVRDLAGSRFDWEQAIRDLSRAVPAGVTLSSFTGDLGAADAAGASSGAGLRGAITAPAITLTGCTGGQSAVATLMARLRSIDGVTRVSLAKSDKEGSAGGSSAGTVGPPCASENAPVFEIVVFFEGAAAATTAPAPGGGAAPATSGTATPASTPAPGDSTPAGGTTTTQPASATTP